MNFRSLTVVALFAVLGVNCVCQSELSIGPDRRGGGGSDGGGADGGRVGGGMGGGMGGGGGASEATFSLDGGCGLVTCSSAQANCGLIGDGCGAVIDCGSCFTPQTCGGGGTPNRCGGTLGCVPRTCRDVGASCGAVSDGCGDLLDCGSCTAPATCGGSGAHNQCGEVRTVGPDAGLCTRLTCSDVNAQCGVIGDGCGGIVMCPSCGAGQTCGGGGVPYVCGGGASCTPRSCPPGACGAYGDGCGSILNCTTTCTAPQTCGGAGVANQCGGGTTCTPRALATLFPDGGACGFIGDGCGNVLDAGSNNCPNGTACGAGGVPNRCGGSAPCVAQTCQTLGVNCGTVGNGCGASLTCGACTDGGTCGGGGAANVCGAPAACVPKTCQQLAKNCGQVGDGCGGLTVNCGTCTAPDICGGANVPSVCGSVVPDAGAACTNLCTSQSCRSTTLTGTVRAPTPSSYGTADPIPGALVYVPNGTVTPFDAGVSCDRCTDSVSGSPLVSAYSATDGTFTLANVPCGVDVPLVIQLGRWRRQLTVPAVACCSTNALTAEQTRLPRRQAEGHPNDNIPLIAVVTGSADSIENVLPKIGINYADGGVTSQYSLPTGSGRVHFYRDNGYDFGSSPSRASLVDDLNQLRKYDMVIFDCTQGENLRTAVAKNNLEAYLNAGGRAFFSHYEYTYLFDRASTGTGSTAHTTSLSATATWLRNENDRTDQATNVYLDISFEKGRTFAAWLQLVGAQVTPTTPTTQPQISVFSRRNDITAELPPSQRWVFRDGATDGNAPPSGGSTVCQAATCSTFGYSCGGLIPDGCGNQVRCRQNNQARADGCTTSGTTCGGGGVAGQCGANGPACVPKTCGQLGFDCGIFNDGCGGTLTCGTCTGKNVCGGGGTAGKCGSTGRQVPLLYTVNTPVSAAPANQCGRVLFNDFHVSSSNAAFPGNNSPLNAQEKTFEYLIFDLSSCIAPDVQTPQVCTPRSCAAQGLNCGAAANGCGGTIASCGTCSNGETCGASGTPGVCGAACLPRTCNQLGFNCGPQGDGCGGTLSCGVCTGGQTCGGGGSPGVCGGGTCVPRTCEQLGFGCGLQGDGCGGTLNCGACTAPATCGGGGTPGVCGGGSTCTVKTCTELGFNCGQQTDGCGGTQNCGSCSSPTTCGGGGLPGVCGGGGMCTPNTCQGQGFTCGAQGDGCGGTLMCGTCATNALCGAVTPGQCGTVACQPRSCAQQNLFCGPTGDGCGGFLNCGTCAAPDTCGGGGVQGVCGRLPCTPRTCAQAGATCGAIADNCGGVLQCGVCTTGTCGGAFVPNQCGQIN